MLTTEVAIIDPKDFGLEQTQAVEITNGLNQILDERTTLSEMYAETIKMEISEENIPAFKALRLKIRDNRTKGIEAWHKVNKEFYLKGGQFVDAIRRKESAENERMEANLLECEKHFENLEIERLKELQSTRAELVSLYVEDASLLKLSEMDDDVFEAFLSVKKKSYEDKLAEEAKIEAERLEAEKKAELYKTRKEELLPFWDFVKEDHKSADFGELPKEAFDIILGEVKTAKVEHEKEVEAQRVENERLKKEAEEKQAKIDAEKALMEKRNNELRLYINFIRDYNGLLAKDEEEYQKELSDIKRGYAEQQEYDRLAKEKAEAEQLKLEKAQKELEKRKELEEKTKKDAEAEALKAKKEADKLAKAPKETKLLNWIDGFVMGTPVGLDDDETVKEILSTFEKFKVWAKEEIKKS